VNLDLGQDPPVLLLGMAPQAECAPRRWLVGHRRATASLQKLRS
jgi:hypothetical protein